MFCLDQAGLQKATQPKMDGQLQNEGFFLHRRVLFLRNPDPAFAMVLQPDLGEFLNDTKDFMKHFFLFLGRNVWLVARMIPNLQYAIRQPLIVSEKTL